MKAHLEKLLAEAVAALPGDILPPDGAAPTVEIERTRDPRHGDFSSNIAMRMAKAAGKNPRELAQVILKHLPPSDLVEKAAPAGPGFINFTMTHDAFCREVGSILKAGDRYGHSEAGSNSPAIVEFVSANPTGPLHVGHGRLAAYGATVANLLEASGHKVHREYYINDSGRQMDILAASTWLRYLELLGESFSFPANAYRGDYLRAIAESAREKWDTSFGRPAVEVFDSLPPDAPEGDKDAYIDAVIKRSKALIGEESFRHLTDLALEHILTDIRDDLTEFGVTFDEWFSERRVTEGEAIRHALQRLEERKELYEKDGAKWFRAAEYGDEKDRVVVRENGQTTYFASDIAYHLHKRERGYDLLLDVLGADHHGYVARVRAGLEAMGEPGDCLEVRLVQFVSLYRSGQKVQMSTRSGDFVTLRQLREEVGNDAARFFYVLRSNDQHLDFDLELAKSKSLENPVHYVQYAHARVSSVFRKIEEQGLEWSQSRGCASLSRLTERLETGLMISLSRLPEMVQLAANNRAPHTLVHYLRDLSSIFHAYYNAHKFIIDDIELRDARLALIAAAQQVIRNGLTLLGVSSPDSM